MTSSASFVYFIEAHFLLEIKNKSFFEYLLVGGRW